MGLVDEMKSTFSGGGDPTDGGFSSPLNSVTGGLGDYGTHLANAAGFANSKSKSGMGQMQDSVNQQNAADQTSVDQMGKNADTYADSQQANVDAQKKGYAGNVTGYQQDLAKSKTDLQTQATDSKSTYSNTVLPNLQNLITSHGADAKNAMSLKDAMDPNNKVATDTRGMYNTQAQGIQNQGLADYGVLAALGGQATANTVGGAGQPFTGGQMAAMQNANMGQASQAFGNAQTNANNLRLQGIQAGQDQSNWAYNAGQQAQNAYGQSVSDYMQADNQMNGIQRQYNQDEQGIDNTNYGLNQGVTQNNFNMDSGMSGLRYGLNQQKSQNQMAENDKQAGAQQAFDTAQIQAGNAAQAGKLGAIGSLVGGAFGYMNAGGDKAASAAGPAAAAATGNPAAAAAGGGGGGGGGGSTMSSVSQGAQLGSSIFQGGFGSYQQAPNLGPGYGGQPGPYAGGYQPGAYSGYGQPQQRPY